MSPVAHGTPFAPPHQAPLSGPFPTRDMVSGRLLGSLFSVADGEGRRDWVGGEHAMEREQLLAHAGQCRRAFVERGLRLVGQPSALA